MLFVGWYGQEQIAFLQRWLYRLLRPLPTIQTLINKEGGFSGKVTSFPHPQTIVEDFELRHI